MRRFQECVIALGNAAISIYAMTRRVSVRSERDMPPVVIRQHLDPELSSRALEKCGLNNPRL